MDENDFQALVRNEIEQAVNYQDGEFASARVEALDNYLGKPLGNEVEGRSQVIQTEVSDAIEMILPGIMKIFATTDDFVRFEPRDKDDVDAAAQATRYVNFILNRDNDGFVILHHFFKDALLFGLGVVKHFWMETETTAEEEHRGLNDDALTALLVDDDIEVIGQDTREIGEPQILQDGSLLPAQMIYDVRVRRTHRTARVKIENVPPEEFLFSQRTKSLEEARFVAHRTTMTVSELVDMGYDREMVEGHAGPPDVDALDEKQSRFEDIEGQVENTTSDISQRDVAVVEAYIRADYADDGKSELRRVVCLGAAHEIVENEPFHMVPFSVISPILMPHRMVGRSVAELLIPLQQSKTAVLRQLLDNIYLMNNARIGAVEGQVNLDDLIANRPGGIVRMRAPGMVQPLTPPSVADSAFPLLAYLDQVREMRTGLSKASLGLDPDALQSSSAAAVNATISAAQAKIEMIARVFAETGVKRMMLSILQIVQHHQQQPREILLGGDAVSMEPAVWEMGFDAVVNVGLGNGDERQRGAALLQVAAKQEQVLIQMGIDNPLCTLAQYRRTLVKMLEMAGFKNGDDFFLDPENLPLDVEQRYAAKLQSMQQGGVDTDRMKAEADIKLDREKMLAQLDIKREEIRMKFELRKQEMEYEAQLRGIEAAAGGDISSNMPRQ
jgi:hypothetical protein